MRTVAIVQARMGSTRLPGKVLMNLEGVSVLGWVVRRLRGATRIQEILVATTEKPEDDVIADECRRLCCPIFRGSSEDVLDRYYWAAQEFSAETIVRITSDCPLIDPELVDETIEKFEEQDADYASNSLDPSFPRGLDVEAFTAQSLARAWRDASLSYERQHVTPYIYEHHEVFRIASLRAPIDYSRYRWTLDTAEDLQLIREIFAHFRPQTNFGWKEILGLMEREPHLVSLNAAVVQKALHAT